MEKKQPEVMVSICCITFNQKDYIRDALEGFLKQKTDFSYEILIHDCLLYTSPSPRDA